MHSLSHTQRPRPTSGFPFTMWCVAGFLLFSLLCKAFHVVVPSLPGYGFSSPATKPGQDVQVMQLSYPKRPSHMGLRTHIIKILNSLLSLKAMAVDLAKLMARLGYSSYFAQVCVFLVLQFSSPFIGNCNYEGGRSRPTNKGLTLKSMLACREGIGEASLLHIWH